MKRLITFGVAAAALTAVACGPSPEVQERLERLQVVSAEKDSLLTIVTENARLMSEITREIAAVTPDAERVTAAGESPYAMTRDSILARVRAVTERVRESEERLARSQRRIRNLAGVSDSLRTQLAQYDTIMVDLRATIDNQKATILSLTERVEQLRLENVQLAGTNEALEDTLRNVEGELNTAYYVVGTRDELKELGVIREEGGSRFPLIFTKVGETLVPANELDPERFQAIDVRDTREIMLPDSTSAYEIVSAQNLAALEAMPEDGKLRGTIRIANPQEFWSTSRFLILVRS